MGRVVRIINGFPTTVEESFGGATYQDTYSVVAPLAISAQVTLPNGETYDGTKSELVVKRNGQDWTEGVQYEYQNNASATYITLLEAIPSGGRLDFYKVT